MNFFRKILTFIIFQVCCFNDSISVDLGSYPKNQELRKKLLKDYDKISIPHIDVNGTITVTVRLMTRRVSLDDETQIFTLNAWAATLWRDDRLKWDNKDYGGLDKTYFGDNEIWKPDILVYNNAEGSEIDHYGNVHFMVFNDGTVIWSPPVIFKVPCSINLKFWPFDTQECKVIIGSWTTHGLQIDLELYPIQSEPDNSDLMMKDSDKWKLIKETSKRKEKYYPQFKSPYITLEYSYTIKRNSPHFAAFVVIPALVIPIFLMIQFILPVNHSKRLSIGFISFILIMIELCFLKYSIPKIGSNVSLVVTYYSQLLFIVLLTVLISAILERLSHPTHPLLDFPPPEIIKRILTGPLAVILCVSNHASKVGMSGTSAEDGNILTDDKSPNFSHEWLLIARVVDRISFILLTCIFILSLIGYIGPVK